MAGRSRPRRPNPPNRAGATIRSKGVVGIGASAGGLEAFQTFFKAMPPDSGLAFVLILHLAPSVESLLAELVGRRTQMPVRQVTKDTPLEPNQVYVIAPDATLTLRSGVLHVGKRTEAPHERATIDLFLRSLAEEQGTGAVAIVLSGSGSDGAVGLQAVKEHGGITMAQKSGGAQFHQMPQHAVATGLVDHVLDVQDMPAVLMDWVAHRSRLNEHLGPDGLQRDAVRHLQEVHRILRRRTGHDFSQYKSSTIIRRLLRRLQLGRFDTFRAYVARLRKDGEEVEELFKDLLIGVTHFFRDPEAFAVLERQVIRPLLSSRGADDRVRIWAPGCASGEEAYSLAMLLRENLPSSDGAPHVQIFASDIDDAALDVGRAGRYSQQAVENVSPERRDRFFTRQGSTWAISKEIREMVLFASHNIIRDPPFSRLDLISCRNLLIYMEPELQKKLVPLLHYALEGDGYLFLGPSEKITSHADLFRAVDKLHGIYQRKNRPNRPAPELPLARVPHYTERPRERAGDAQAAAPSRVAQTAERVLLQEFGPAGVVVDEHGYIMQFFGRTGRLLEPPPGSPTTNVHDMARRELRADLRVLLREVERRKERVERPAVPVQFNGAARLIALSAYPLPEHAEQGLYLVAFVDHGPAELRRDGKGRGKKDKSAPTVSVELERELGETRERLQTTIEELESSNEELKSQSEELMSMNEEMQSTNEELETSREELQSLNEELETVNAELQNKVGELSHANSDLENLLRSTRIATVFLDAGMRIRSFTPAATDMFRLIENDVGRPITDIAARFDTSELLRDIRHVLKTLETRERQVRVADGDGWHIMRILPYRTLDNVISGTVITFSDVSQLKRTEEKLRESEERFRVAVQNVPLALACCDTQLRYTWVHDPGLGVFPEDVVGRREEQVQRPGDGKLLNLMRQVVAEGRPLRDEITLEPDGRRRTFELLIEPLRDRQGGLEGCCCAAFDVSERKASEDHKSSLLAELNHRVKNTLATVLSISAQTLPLTGTSEEFQRAFEARLRGLSAVHDLLSRAQWTRIGLRQLVEVTLKPYAAPDTENFDLRGPDVPLTPTVTLALGMVFNELATNAAKYGALSKSGGRVKVRWTLETSEEQVLRIEWIENDGPAVATPQETGFGVRFVKESIEYELSGTATFDFRRSGLRCTVLVPDPALAQEAGKAGAPQKRAKRK